MQKANTGLFRFSLMYLNDMKKIYRVAIALFVFSVTFAGVYLVLPRLMSQQQPETPQSIFLKEPKIAQNFSLTDQNGEPFNLSQLRGKSVVLFFGYTHCPDICPLTLSEMMKMYAALGSDAQKISVVFISVDGERDTPEVLKRYLSAFNPDFIGLTGRPDQVREVAKFFDAAFQKQKPQDVESTSYTMIHTSYAYLLDAQGQWRATFPYGSKPETMAANIRALTK